MNKPNPTPGLSGNTPTSADLVKWLDDLVASAPIEYPDHSQHACFAVIHQDLMRKLLRDGQVTACVDQSLRRLAQTLGPVRAFENIATLLVQGCWMSRIKRPSQSATLRGTRTETTRELLAAAAAARRLSKATKQLVNKAISVDYLVSRYNADNPVLFTANRKGWKADSAKPSRVDISDLLNVLANDLTEEAAFLLYDISRNRQTSTWGRGKNMLTDVLMGRSVSLGAVDSKGEPTPDFPLVHALVTSLEPEKNEEITTSRKRWNSRQRKLKLKNT